MPFALNGLDVVVDGERFAVEAGQGGAGRGTIGLHPRRVCDLFLDDEVDGHAKPPWLRAADPLRGGSQTRRQDEV